MKTVVITVFLGLAALMLGACGTRAKNTSANRNADTTKPIAAAPTADALLALDKQANEAYIKSDSKFFERMLSDKFVMHEAGQQMDKVAVIKMIAGNKCDVKDWKLGDPQMAKIDADTYVLSYKGTFDGSCTAPDGMSMKIPSPIRAATVWARTGDTWRAAFHGENLIFDPKNPPPAKAEGNKEKPTKDDKAAATKPAADPSTAAMMAIEKSVWEAWKAKDDKGPFVPKHIRHIFCQQGGHDKRLDIGKMQHQERQRNRRCRHTALADRWHPQPYGNRRGNVRRSKAHVGAGVWHVGLCKGW